MNLPHPVRRAARVAFLLNFACAHSARAEEAVITVDAATLLREITSSPLGINLNYLRDDPALRPPGSADFGAALLTLGSHWLRYPGGEKSDWHYFAPPPFEKPAPVTLGHYQAFRKEALDFDEYMQVVRRVKGEPYVVAAFDAFARTGQTRAQYLAHAVGWVKYANVTRGYGVKYWEIGNENWHNQSATAEEMVGVIQEFSRAMKAADPSVKIGTSANNRAWAETILNGAGDDLDFISYSNYFYAKFDEGFGKYAGAAGLDLVAKGRAIAEVVAHSKSRGKIEVIAAEFGAGDLSKQLPLEQRWEGNDLGHALTAFDMAGQFLCESRITAALFWGTRWMEDLTPNRRCYALGAKNEVMPVGQAFAIWHRFLRRQMIAASSVAAERSFASYDPASGQLSVLIVNRSAAARTVRVDLPGEIRTGTLQAFCFTGQNPADTHPTFESVVTGHAAGRAISGVALAPYSITVLALEVTLP